MLTTLQVIKKLKMSSMPSDIGSRTRPRTLAKYGPNFAAIAERMLEVVTCIDITDDQSAERPNDFVQLLERNPNLIDCKIDWMG